MSTHIWMSLCVPAPQLVQVSHIQPTEIADETREVAALQNATLLGKDPFEKMHIPEALQESLQRHREHLANLIASLEAVGLSEEQIEQSVSVIVNSYKDELVRAIKTMVR